MSTEQDQMIAVFKQFVEAGLIEHDAERALAVIAEDIIGVGMGEQGMVSCKADAERLLRGGKADSESVITIRYANLLSRFFTENYGVVCGIIEITTITNGKVVHSALGQMVNVRRENGKWMICVAQATPIFDEIEAMEAYPIKFAENVLDKYRQQEQIAQNAQNDSIAFYSINFTTGLFESFSSKSELVINTQAGEQYEAAMFGAAHDHLNEAESYKFISTFSLGNVLKAYQSGLTELSMDYERLLPNGKSVWLRTVIKLYTDRVDKNLKGYLYVFDIDKEKRRELELQNKAELDSLTGLYNKNSTELKIDEKMKLLSDREPCAFFMIDLDRFKTINDTYGHQEGDRIIRETANAIRSLSRQEDIAGRVGGDEFCIYFHGGLTPTLVASRAGALCDAIRAITLPDGVGISCSIGVVFCPGHGLQFGAVYQKADKALYQQKSKGRNGYTVCSDIL